MRRGGTGLTLLEVLIAVAILGLAGGWLLQVRVESVRQAREQRRHVTLSQLLRSEAEALRSGAWHLGGCASLSLEEAAAGYACRVVEGCALPPEVCAAAPGLRALRIEASGPGGRLAELALVVRADPHRWIEARR